MKAALTLRMALTAVLLACGSGSVSAANEGVLEHAANVVLQVPGQVDGYAPVPFLVSVFQQPDVQSISLLADGAEPALLGEFHLTTHVMPYISGRFAAQKDLVLLAVASTPSEVLVRRTRVIVVPAFGPQDVVANESADPDPQLVLRQNGKSVDLVVSNVPTLLSVSPASKAAKDYVSHFSIFQGKKRLLSTDLTQAMWYKPFFQFRLKSGNAKDTYTLRWQRMSGKKGQVKSGGTPSDTPAR